MMKKILTMIVFYLFIINSTQAESIKDIEIEGISIGDSALKYFSKDLIEKNKRNYYKNKKYTPVDITPSFFETYTIFSFSYKTNDKKYIIQRMSGVISYKNKDIKNCFKQVDEVADEISEVFEGSATIPFDLGRGGN